MFIGTGLVKTILPPSERMPPSLLGLTSGLGREGWQPLGAFARSGALGWLAGGRAAVSDLDARISSLLFLVRSWMASRLKRAVQKGQATLVEA